jgi:hypothetical protein
MLYKDMKYKKDATPLQKEPYMRTNFRYLQDYKNN